MTTPLDYAPRANWNRRFRWGRWIVICTLISVGIGVYRLRSDIAIRFDYWRWQKRCAIFRLPEGQVVYEHDPIRAAALLKDQNLKAAASQAFQDWTALVAACPDHSGWSNSTPANLPLLMHELRAPNGLRRLVNITYFGFGSNWEKEQPRPLPGSLVRSIGTAPSTQPEPFISSEMFIADVLTPGYFSPPVQSRGHLVSIETQRRMVVRTGGSFMADPQPEDVIQRIYAGRLDPNDRSHFTINYETSSGYGVFDGRLLDDGTVKIDRLPLNSSTGQ